MSIALGVHVGVEEVTAVLVEADLPELGPVSTRSVSVASAPGGVGDAVTTMLGIMRVQAAQNDLHIVGSGVVCDSIALCGIVRDALASHRIRDVVVVDAGDPRLDAEVPMGIAAALFGDATGPAAFRGEMPADADATSDDDWSPSGDRRSDTPRSARLTMVGLGVAVLAALSGATVWALAAPGPEQSPAVDTADAVVEMPSSATVVVDSTGAPLGSSSAATADAQTLDVAVFGPLPVGAWSEPVSASPVPNPSTEASRGSGGSGGGNSAGVRPDPVTVGGGNASGDTPDSDESGGGRTSTDDPKPQSVPNPQPQPQPVPNPQPQPQPEPEPQPEPKPETEIPGIDPPAGEVPTATEPTSGPDESAAEQAVEAVE